MIGDFTQCRRISIDPNVINVVSELRKSIILHRFLMVHFLYGENDEPTARKDVPIDR